MKSFIAPAAAMLICLLGELAAVAPAHAQAVDTCVYERDTVTVSGEVHRKHRKGAPDDEDSYLRGRTDTAIILKLQHALCVMLPDDVNLALRPRRIQELQLVTDERLPRSSERIRRFEGTVLLDQDGSHQRPVLLEIKQTDEGNKPVRKQR
ncbi:MAG TPA: hypothetical protein VFW93_03950 [Aquabacterium sp.]|uniref:hypothetical protein n=1 Tax=Aquabacterium sp. TaxID=1872578 RepID=UPI002E2F0B37|nr:hypothetical protein [Aquabacterium sp.]HEX5355346.1 hypothetical protein [Aquabacterium sp.]